MANGQTIEIDGKSYEIDSLSDEAKSQFGNIRAVDAELKRIEQRKAIAQTARNAYARALQEELAKVEPQQ
ncbi:DUF6447 family protein [Sulfitobacter sp.]|jgi:hypothetical protein|uniref:DUF6447 family protein n=1 Tax=Sulfitobacter sp. TaxID=1903071 RepID=UPI00261E9EAF|nr:DUF6447 family protein [Sulfitobacter sp.]|tara:strand:+ start:1005 stop:1214 length:210 start_codon:yes stop_codon:yes gene_type:complete